MLYIMRHGQTDWNTSHKLQGRTDIPLNENGRRMAVCAREKYAELPFDLCYSSPLKRARETAEIFLEGRGIPLITDERLMELSFGEYEGIESVFEKPGHPVYQLFHTPVEYVPSGGSESLEELFLRTGSFLSEVIIPQLAEGKNILIVGHGAMNLSIINRILGIPLKDFWKRLPGNCEVVEFENRKCLLAGKAETH